MKDKMDIGSLKKLNEADIRKLWPGEARDFSPWLAENISHLNDVLNIRIEIEELEGSVETFKLDLSGIDRVSQRPVVIENQFGKSNHDHLGKLLTYAANREAGIVIWIANEVQLAHRKSIEWLNQITPVDMSFYAIEFEAFKIGDSKPAPHFRIVSGPPPSKRREIIPAEQITPRNKQYQKFFDRLRTRLLELQPNFTRAKGLPQSWWGLGIGRTGFSLSAAFTIDAKFRIEIYIDTGVKEDNKQALAKLEENKGNIEEKIGHALKWDYLPESRACRVYVAVDGTIDEDENKLQQLIEWGAPIMIKSREVFTPLIKNIDFEVVS